MDGQLRSNVREILEKFYGYKFIEIIEGAVCKDFVQLCVSIPRKMKILEFVGYLKGRSAIMMFDKYGDCRDKLDKKFWQEDIMIAR